MKTKEFQAACKLVFPDKVWKFTSNEMENRGEFTTDFGTYVYINNRYSELIYFCIANVGVWSRAEAIEREYEQEAILIEMNEHHHGYTYHEGEIV